MKNIMIITTYEADTFGALKIAADLKRYHDGSLVLLTVSPLSDSITELLFLSARDHVEQQNRKKRLEEWNRFATNNKVYVDFPEIKEHHQYGMSGPILKQILECFDIDMIVVPPSMQKSRFFIHQLLLKLLHRSQYPLLLLSTDQLPSEPIQRALFLDGLGESLTAEIENMPFHVIHKSMLEQVPQISPLRQLIEKHKIDLIVQRKQKSSTGMDKDLQNLGLPILTV